MANNKRLLKTAVSNFLEIVGWQNWNKYQRLQMFAVLLTTCIAIFALEDRAKPGDIYLKRLNLRDEVDFFMQWQFVTNVNYEELYHVDCFE